MTNKILQMSIEETKSALRSNSISICVVGVGRIGLPTALSFANTGLHTVGLDIDENLVSRLNSGDYPLKDEPHYDRIFELVLAEKKFKAVSSAKDAISQSDVILLSLPTPMNNENVPDYSALRDVGMQLNQFLTEDSLVIVESTVEPGFVENELIGIIEGTNGRLVAGKNFGIGSCPENANPGEIFEYTSTRPRLVGAINDHTADIISELYQSVFSVKMIRLPDCKTANAVKLTGNVFRDVNIAFVNELSILFEKMEIDTYTVLEAAKAKRMFLAHDPGAGVGGPCIPVNSYQFLNLARSLSGSFKIIEASRKINEHMPFHVIGLIKDIFENTKKNLGTSTIMILGITYKPNVKDVQLTPAEPIIDKLKDMCADVKIFDPFFKGEKIFGVTCENSLYEGLAGCDGIVIVTNHDEFTRIDLGVLASKMRTPILVDTRGLVSKNEAEKAGLIFKGLGR
ncbi:MAG: nucleotide sugar dehydrogenase [Nitrosopumilus sp. B06]|nr:MAG: nucleotide sugar dehydrogenase [Nitrosopumilus sp. B06]